jgi:hypothetical protein
MHLVNHTERKSTEMNHIEHMIAFLPGNEMLFLDFGLASFSLLPFLY